MEKEHQVYNFEIYNQPERFLRPKENIIDLCVINNSPFIGVITNLNNLYVLKTFVHE
jgi:hypothetical protein